MIKSLPRRDERHVEGRVGTSAEELWCGAGSIVHIDCDDDSVVLVAVMKERASGGYEVMLEAMSTCPGKA